MGKNLVIVESPSKAKTISKYLGKNYVVEASVGHIIDLPAKKIGIDLEDNFKPQFQTIPGKEKVIKTLTTKAETADNIYIATDPDREGEAIAWHIENILKECNVPIYRVEFNEVTKSAVKQALQSPRKTDTARVYSQQARRVLDRLVGYKVSPFLWKSLFKGLSAGRVQSVALRLICEKEEAINAFIPEEYWTVKGDFLTPKQNLVSTKLEKISGKKASIKTGEEADSIVNEIRQSEFQITKLETKELKRKPAPPFVTSTLQQEAVRKLSMTSKRVMSTAQSLYEGIDLGDKGQIGLITYMRTDSFRISNEALDGVRELITTLYGENYLSPKPLFYKSKKSAQDAHEAVRPTTLRPDFAPDAIKSFLNNDQYRLYKLIWNRFLACQMTNALFDKTTVEISDSKYLFRTQGEVSKFQGFLIAYNTLNKEDETSILPDVLELHLPTAIKEILQKQNFTKPPARYTESTIIKELDELGIGRPSTYAQIISVILERKYVESVERRLGATELGMTVNKALVSNFPDLFNVEFTAQMEQNLDKIESSEANYENVLGNFYHPFEQTLTEAGKRAKEIKASLQEITDIDCDKCGSKMIKKMSKNGKFLACSSFPECKNTKPLDKDGNVVVEKIVFTEYTCDNDNARMVLKQGPYGEYLECENFPECKTRKPVPTGAKCPKCEHGDIIGRKSKRGKQFFGCSNYPKCDFISWNEIINEPCPNCDAIYIEKKTTKAKGEHKYCSSCKSTFDLEKE